ncbi:MAG: hypothetical protein DRJ45_04250 [Thermoprotei archaeon]|nr:MAG: hypothetical protein DRJ45_04250 [Thermoprotei archaeon]
MGLLGVESYIESKRIVEELSKYGFKARNERKISVKTKRGLITFTVFDIMGFTEGYANILSRRFNCAALEGGEHLILGEASAKLWEEAVKIVWPDGESEIISILIHDGFLDAIIPTENVIGITGRVFIRGFSFKIPISGEDMDKIISMGKDAIEKIEKIINMYSMYRILSSDAISKILEMERKREEVKEEIDYETGFVVVLKDGKISTIPISTYIAGLIKDNKMDKAKNIINKAPEEIKKDIISFLEEEIEINRTVGDKNYAKKIAEFLKELRKHN